MHLFLVPKDTAHRRVMTHFSSGEGFRSLCNTTSGDNFRLAEHPAVPGNVCPRCAGKVERLIRSDRHE